MSRPSLEPNTLLGYAGQFRLLRQIARGGMATVFEAEQTGPHGFAKRIALKVIHERYSSQSEWRQLFLDEAKLTADLLHGNIVQVYQLGETDGVTWIALEYIQGVTLRQVINRHRELGRPIPGTLAAYIASRVCRALDFAHNFIDASGRRLDIVHRDVSPGNVLLTWDGHVKLADFGIAKAKNIADPAERRPLMMGKKHYMSPEQVLAGTVTWRSDIFAVGVVLFELLALRPLFQEDETEAAIDEVVVQPIPDLRAALPDTDKEMEHLLQLSLSKEPARRPTANYLGKGLDTWCMRQFKPGSPESLHTHLAELFPDQSRLRPSLPPIGGAGGAKSDKAHDSLVSKIMRW